MYLPPAANSAIPHSTCPHRGVTLCVCSAANHCVCKHDSRPVGRCVKSLQHGGDGNNGVKEFLHVRLFMHCYCATSPSVYPPCPWSQVLTITRLSRSANTQFKEPNKPDGICEICPHVIIASQCPHASHSLLELPQPPPVRAAAKGDL